MQRVHPLKTIGLERIQRRLVPLNVDLSTVRSQLGSGGCVPETPSMQRCQAGAGADMCVNRKEGGFLSDAHLSRDPLTLRWLDDILCRGRPVSLFRAVLCLFYASKRNHSATQSLSRLAQRGGGEPRH